MMSTNCPSSFTDNRSLLSFGDNLAYKYAPGMSYVDTSLPSYASISNVTINDSEPAVGKSTDLSYFKYFLCLLPITHI